MQPCRTAFITENHPDTTPAVMTFAFCLCAETDAYSIWGLVRDALESYIHVVSYIIDAIGLHGQLPNTS